MDEVWLGDIAGVSVFGVGHRLAGPRLLAVNDGGELVGGAAPLAVCASLALWWCGRAQRGPRHRVVKVMIQIRA